MSDLLELAVQAHGGWERWQQLNKLTAHIAATGGLWRMKGWPDALADATVTIELHRQHVEYAPFLAAGQRSVFTSERTAIVDVTGAVIEQRVAPKDAFAGHTMTTPWDAQHLIYFSGYAIWTYLTTPFLFRQPGFEVEEIAPWEENGETWRRLKVHFPPAVPSHSPTQIFYFNAAGILQRHDYSVDLLGGTASANYATEPQQFGGIVIPTKRRVYAIGPDNKPLLERLALSIDLDNIELS